MRISGGLAYSIVAVLLAASIVVVGLAWGSKTVGGADSYGYASQADLFLEGRLVDQAPWIAQVPWPGAQVSFRQLGWVHRGREAVMVPQYAPGLPLLMAAAKALAGHCAIFWISPIAGGLMVWLTFVIGRRFVSDAAGLLAAGLVATSPAFLNSLLQPMSDVPVSAAWLVACWALAMGRTPMTVLAGLAASLAVMIRPNLAPILVPIGLWLVSTVWTAPAGERGAAWRRLLVFVLLAAPGFAAVAFINDARYGSPFKSGYEPVSLLYTWANVGPNAARYFRWFVETQTIVPLAGVLALLVPVSALWPREGARPFALAGAGVLAFLCLQYFAYFVFDDWSYLRFFLPAWPFVMIGSAALLVAFARRAGQAGTVAVVVAVLAVGAWTTRLATADGVWATARLESKYHVTGRLVDQLVEPGSVLIGKQHSGSLRYYAGLMTMNFEGLDEAWLDPAVAWFAARGVKVYAVLEEWEVELFRARFTPQNRLGRLAMSPSLIYRGPTTVHVYDFSRSEARAETLEWPDVDRSRECVPPRPKPVLRLR